MTAAGIEAAEEAGLRWVTDAGPGIRRVRRGRGFAYFGPEGEPVGDARTLARIRSLVIPPAWRDVWICPTPRGHIQATGRDARGRKQYLYHPDWRAARDETKFHRMRAFGHALPGIRARVDYDMRRPGLGRERILATLVRLLDSTAIRIGSEQYARENESYGLTTLTNEHVSVAGSRVTFVFRGKSGKEHCIDIRDRRVAHVLRGCEDLPGQQLFQYADELGQPHRILSEDVNRYLKDVAGDDFTVKDFRTWNGTVITVRALVEGEQPASATAAKRSFTAAIKVAARALGNTPAVCRSSYVHPFVFDVFASGGLHDAWRRNARRWSDSVDDPAERLVLYYLDRLAAAA